MDIYDYLDYINEKQSTIVISESDYLDITKNSCAVRLIEYFTLKTAEWDTEDDFFPWLEQPFRKIYEDLGREYSQRGIQQAIALLGQKGILERRRNPRNGQVKTFQYKLNLYVLESIH